jgi:hypothetical protein
LFDESKLIERGTKIVLHEVRIFRAGAEPLASKPVSPPGAKKTKKAWLGEAVARFPKGPDESVNDYSDRLSVEAEREGLAFSADTIRVRYYDHLRVQKVARSKKGRRNLPPTRSKKSPSK